MVLCSHASMEHTLGPACRLRPTPDADKDDGAPCIKAQFFYTSLFPIDDPLSSSAPAGGADSKSKAPLRPFSQDDNDVLQQAWLGLASESHRIQHEAIRSGREPGPSAVKSELERRDQVIRQLASKHIRIHEIDCKTRTSTTQAAETLPETLLAACCPRLTADILEKLDIRFCTLVRKTNQLFAVDEIVKDIIAVINQHHELTSAAGSSRNIPIRHPLLTRDREASISIGRPSPSDSAISSSYGEHMNLKPRSDSYKQPSAFPQERILPDASRAAQTSQNRLSRELKFSGQIPAADDGISGRPFVRALENEENQQRSDAPTLEAPQINDKLAEENDQVAAEPLNRIEDTTPEPDKENIDVVVGLARLHKVSLQTLQMEPIYWSPVNDIAVVTRGTWFYKDTMLPVPPAVANQLEAGYQELRPWAETWRDEVRCAIEVGASGEEKVSHRLWPIEGDGQYRNSPIPTKPAISAHPYCAAHCFQGEAATEGSLVPQQMDDDEEASENAQQRPYSSYSVMYKDQTSAFLLKPSLQASAYYGRRPLQKIMRGATVGIPVTRGFDRLSWERMHRGKQVQHAKPASQGSSDGGAAAEICPACQADKDRTKVTDLVLVAHGIGQKIAERVESYHFTHAVNSFRRMVDGEFQNPAVQDVLDNSQSRLMVLPLNWRIGLSFEDGGTLQTGMEANDSAAAQAFGLKDIEPNTIPAIRSMISDVMFDIPFYMSHHKGKMIAALVKEANRVYRLWCRNNPGFAENGRVHLVAHSLGSVMAVEVLSRQPTDLPPLDLMRPKPETKFFEFDTTNLFLMGSPTAFFLLLERGALTPRRGRVKPGMDENEIKAENIGGDSGMFGCLAVDNIYNILAKEDPIAYLLNGTVDPAYAASLKTAYVPTYSASFLKSVGDAMRNAVIGRSAKPTMSTAGGDGRPSTVRLPSQLELEVHDFTREEIAEKKAFLLNDNGQIDWSIRSGGGPLEIQYLNMLSAHSSYWSNTDFIRMLCIEIGRKPGRAHTLPVMRAVKASRRNIPITR
ncbi:DDHD domain-containing protein [Trichoderma austrokoningii]